jgi:serine/alanine adding enzyme
VSSAPDRQTASITVSEDPQPAAWDAFVERHPAATRYHQWAWRDVFSRTFGHRAVYLAASSATSAASGGEIVGILPLVVLDTWLFGRFAVSLPFVNYGGVVASDEAVAKALVDEAARIAAARGWKHVELRHLEQRFTTLAPKRHKVAMMLPLAANETALWDQLDRKVRNQVRKAQKVGFTTAIGGVELVDDYYQVFARTMRDLGTPVYAKRLFVEILSNRKIDAKIHVVRLEQTPVAASLTIGWRDIVEVPWAASLKEQRSNNPNMLLYWEMLRTAVADGRSTFDFGRSTPDEGTFHFKKQWGAQAQPMCWEYWLPAGREMPEQNPDNPKFKAAITAWQKLPVGVANVIGPHIVRGIA